MTPEQKNAIEKHGIITLYQLIDADSLENFHQALLLARSVDPSSPITLCLCGYGGATCFGTGILTLIQNDGNIDGIAVGDVTSTHSWLWAACNRRYISPNASMNVHPTYLSTDERIDQHRGRLIVATSEAADDMYAQLYAEASGQPEEFWMTMLKRAAGYELLMPASMLVEMGMAQYIADKPLVEWKGQ